MRWGFPATGLLNPSFRLAYSCGEGNGKKRETGVTKAFEVFLMGNLWENGKHLNKFGIKKFPIVRES
jgi:hypothetical protein